MGINITIIGQMITFGVFVWFTMKFVWPPINKAMQERSKKIAAGLALAEKAEKDLLLSNKKIIAELRQARIDAAAIIENATKKSLLIIEEAKAQARVDNQRVLGLAKEQIQQEVNLARKDLQQDLAEMVMLSTNKVIGNLLTEEMHKNLIDKSIQEIK